MKKYIWNESTAIRNDIQINANYITDNKTHTIYHTQQKRRNKNRFTGNLKQKNT